MAGFTIEVEGMDYLDMLVKNLKTIPMQKFFREIMTEAKKDVIADYSKVVGFSGLGGGSGSGNKDFTASVSTTKTGATLTVRGKDVGFIEFGAGLYTTWDEFAEQVPYSVAVGSYSIWHGSEMGQFARSGFNFWYYDDQKFTGLVPSQGMQHALDKLRHDMKDRIRKRIAEWIVNGK